MAEERENSQNDEIIKKELELREREIALKEKEMELKILQAQGSENSAEKQYLKIEQEKLKLARYSAKGVILLIAIFILSVFVLRPIVAIFWH